MITRSGSVWLAAGAAGCHKYGHKHQTLPQVWPPTPNQRVTTKKGHQHQNGIGREAAATGGGACPCLLVTGVVWVEGVPEAAPSLEAHAAEAAVEPVAVLFRGVEHVGGGAPQRDEVARREAERGPRTPRCALGGGEELEEDDAAERVADHGHVLGAPRGVVLAELAHRAREALGDRSKNLRPPPRRQVQQRVQHHLVDKGAHARDRREAGALDFSFLGRHAAVPFDWQELDLGRPSIDPLT